MERVAQAETAALQQAEDLRARLAAVEERLQRLAITRETLTEFTGDHLSHADVAEGDGVVVEEEPPDPARFDPEVKHAQLPGRSRVCMTCGRGGAWKIASRTASDRFPSRV
ncbi:hypothetical protein ACQEVF_25635 [Nonomuraea polychroma]|uniref:hypothetical protein n=1 Tax=Nonomuraea polychroma TaxID=46176 RepID=UPI003D946AD3